MGINRKGVTNMKKITKSVVAGLMSLSLVLAFAMPVIVGAQSADPYAPPTIDDLTGTGLGTASITTIIQEGIGIFMSILGVIVVFIILWGGFIWMTAGGDPEKVNKAKKMIISGITGLIIIFAAWGIATFVIGALQNATGANVS